MIFLYQKVSVLNYFPACSWAKASRDVPAVGKRRLTTSGILAGASEVATSQKKSWKRGSGADDGRRATTPLAICAGLRAMPVTSAAWETAQPAEAAETVAPSQTGWDVPAAREEMLSMSGMWAGASKDAATQKGSRRLQGQRVTAVTRMAALRMGGRSCKPASPIG
jgi:hypothetical protein